MNKLDLYNSRVRDLMSQEYRRTSADKQRYMNREFELVKLMSDPSVSHRDYVNYEKELNNIKQDIVIINIELNVWDTAREICFKAADDICDK